MEITFLISSIILIIVAGFAEAVMDKLQFHYDKSIFLRFANQRFWNPEISWVNKWKNGDPIYGEKFIGSSTIFVGVTDAWHLFKSIRTLSLFTSLLFVSLYLSDSIMLLLAFIAMRIIFGLAFTYFFNLLDN